MTSFHHAEAAYGGEMRVLENKHLRLELFKRFGGWGWGELHGPEKDGKRTFLAILEHFGEVDFPAYAHPMRLEAATCEVIEEGARTTLRFALSMQIPEEPCMAWENVSPVSGTLELSLGADDHAVSYRVSLLGKFRVEYRAFRGPWLRVFPYDAGIRREDAMFPGLEWVQGEEWSSGNDFHGPGNALRVTPHPHKVTVPLMVVAGAGHAVVLSWPTNQNNVSTMDRMRQPQPVFASPNFIDRRPEHVMGLMLPTVGAGLAENSLVAETPMTLPRRIPLVIEAAIGVTPGRSLDAVVDWVKRRPMPEPPPLRWPAEEAFDRIAAALNGNLWVEGTGFVYGSTRGRSWMPVKPWGQEWLRKPHMYLRFVEQYIAGGANREIAAGLQAKAEWCRQQGFFKERPGFYEFTRWYSDEALHGLAARIMKAQRPDGNFPYDVGSTLAHFAQHTAHCDRWKPLGRPGMTVFDLCMTPAILLFQLAALFGREDYAAAAKRALEFAMPIERPAGGDWWECPLQSPNLLSAGHGALAYWLGWKQTGDARFEARARHFLRTMLPFTFLWQPEEKTLLYETKPLYGTTGWHYMAWTNRNVQWQILLIADLCEQVGFDWAKFDPEIDWVTFKRGVVAAGLGWLVDHQDPRWMFRCEDQGESVRTGRMDMVLADVHDPVDDCYGGIGLGLEPNWVASLLWAQVARG